MLVIFFFFEKSSRSTANSYKNERRLSRTEGRLLESYLQGAAAQQQDGLRSKLGPHSDFNPCHRSVDAFGSMHRRSQPPVNNALDVAASARMLNEIIGPDS